ncbi:MAG TPA: hypothetical protein VGE48_01150 [Candidatus Paceibacterota bacterium]
MPETLASSDLRAILKACDPQNGLFPAAPLLAPGLSLIAIGLQSVEAALDQVVDRDERLPPELEALVTRFYDRGTTAYATLHARTQGL